MKCNYCDATFDDGIPHYCVKGRDWLVAECTRLRTTYLSVCKEIDAAERELAALRAAVRYLDDRGAIDVQDETVWVRDGDDMQPAPPEHAEALRKAVEK